MRFFATAAKGTEPALRDELRELRFASVRADRGGVHFEGPVSELSAACRSSQLTHTGYLCQLTKDAVVDRIRARHGARPSVSKHDLRADARAAVRPTLPPLFGSDVSESALALARHSAAQAGLPVELNAVPLREAKHPEAGAVVVNPPYSKRLERPADLGRELARLVDRHADSAVALLTADGQPIGRTRRRPEPLRSVYNGDIACVVRTWSISRQDARER